jgi:methylenetetrahydrofolate dehydrogenase (NADP+)/methenyltetrahydrofolate cyclohydrolase
LTVVLAGDDPASHVYVRNKGIAAKEVGFASDEVRLPATVSQSELLSAVARLNAEPSVDGILVQLPLPAHLSADAVLDALDPAKDVDGLTPTSAGLLASGRTALVPCTPQGCLLLIQDQGRALSGLNAVVLGRSILVGKPVAQLLLAENCTVTIAHSRSQDLQGLTRRADILVAAVGKPGLVRGDWIKPGAVVIDVGINRIEGPDGKTRLTGDVDFEPASRVAGALTPVPGGVGPMTIACLLRNTLLAAARRAGLPPPPDL